MEVLYEDNHLLAINKPAGIATMGSPTDTETMVTRAKAYLKEKYRKTGNVYLGVVSRLDKPVTGVLLFARTSKAATRLTRLFQRRRVKKRYWALVAPESQIGDHGQLEHVLRKNDGHRRMEVCPRDSPTSQIANLSFRTHHRMDDCAFVEIELHTGRKHQIRVQFAATGCPVVGDRKYGSHCHFPRGIALHARDLQFVHPIRNIPLQLVAALPNHWPPITPTRW